MYLRYAPRHGLRRNLAGTAPIFHPRQACPRDELKMRAVAAALTVAVLAWLLSPEGPEYHVPYENVNPLQPLLPLWKVDVPHVRSDLVPTCLQEFVTSVIYLIFVEEEHVG